MEIAFAILKVDVPVKWNCENSQNDERCPVEFEILLIILATSLHLTKCHPSLSLNNRVCSYHRLANMLRHEETDPLERNLA